MEDPLTRFTRTVADYRRYRPTYAPALFDWIEAESGCAPPGPVLDLACGTGIVSGQLSSRGYQVVGLDPNAEMLSAAQGEVPGLELVRSRAERTGLARACFPLIVCGQAFHWFEHESTLAELDRVLQVGGHVSAFWNYRIERGIGADYDALNRKYSPEYVRLADGESILELLRQALGGRRVMEMEFENPQELSWETLVGRSRSASYVVHGMQDVEGFERELRVAFDRHAQDGVVHFPYSTVAMLWPGAS